MFGLTPQKERRFVVICRIVQLILAILVFGAGVFMLSTGWWVEPSIGVSASIVVCAVEIAIWVSAGLLALQFPKYVHRWMKILISLLVLLHAVVAFAVVMISFIVIPYSADGFYSICFASLGICVILEVLCARIAWKRPRLAPSDEEALQTSEAFKAEGSDDSYSRTSGTGAHSASVELRMEQEPPPLPAQSARDFDVRSIPSSRPMSLAETTAHWSTFTGMVTLPRSEIGHLPGCAMNSITEDQVDAAECNCTQIPRALYAAALQHVLATDRQRNQSQATPSLPDYASK